MNNSREYTHESVLFPTNRSLYTASLKKYRLIYALLFLNVLDIITTHIGLKLGASEANPLMSILIGELGEASTYCIKLLVVTIAALLIFRTGKHIILSLLCLGMTAVVLSNVIIFVQA